MTTVLVFGVIFFIAVWSIVGMDLDIKLYVAELRGAQFPWRKKFWLKFLSGPAVWICGFVDIVWTLVFAKPFKWASKKLDEFVEKMVGE